MNHAFRRHVQFPAIAAGLLAFAAVPGEAQLYVRAQPSSAELVRYAETVLAIEVISARWMPLIRSADGRRERARLSREAEQRVRLVLAESGMSARRLNQIGALTLADPAVERRYLGIKARLRNQER